MYLATSVDRVAPALVESLGRLNPILMRASRVDPTPCGGGVVHHSVTLPGNHFPVFSTLARTAKTSSIGRLITMELLTVYATSRCHLCSSDPLELRRTLRLLPWNHSRRQQPMDVYVNPDEVIRETEDSARRFEEEARIKREQDESPEDQDEDADG